ncbi:MAG: hypothetical protein O7D34_02150 [Ignavibacteria bacterium]|nr:hypothetical protein [Ignavibacteria bacterium]
MPTPGACGIVRVDVDKGRVQVPNIYSLEVARRNRENYARWRIRWEEYWAMAEMDGKEPNPYHLMTGRN